MPPGPPEVTNFEVSESGLVTIRFSKAMKKIDDLKTLTEVKKKRRLVGSEREQLPALEL